MVGLTAHHRFGDIIRAVVEGLGMAARDCYAAMGPMPLELRLTGGAARSPALRGVLAEAQANPGATFTIEAAPDVIAALKGSLADTLKATEKQ